MVEAALLLEDHYQEFCDTIWYIHTDEEIVFRRLMENRGYTERNQSVSLPVRHRRLFFGKMQNMLW